MKKGGVRDGITMLKIAGSNCQKSGNIAPIWHCAILPHSDFCRYILYRAREHYIRGKSYLTLKKLLTRRVVMMYTMCVIRNVI